MKRKHLLAILLALFFFLMTMIDTRGKEKIGYCTVDGVTFYPVINHDCKGEWVINNESN